MINGKRIAVVMPAYNAEKTLRDTLSEVPDVVDVCILGDDHSADGTVALARSLGIQVFEHDRNYGYGRNWFYIFQRVTGIFLFFFLLFHILNFRFGAIPGLNTTAVAGNAPRAFAIVAGEFENWAILVVYILGVLATAWHLAYGFWLFAVDWGIVIGERAQKYALYACIGLAVMLGVVGINAAIAFRKPCGLLPAALCEATESKTSSPPRRF